jgi:ABC-type uncharacterized transport system ATPase subunit
MSNIVALISAILTLSTSCSNKPSTDNIKELISDHEKNDMIKYKNHLVAPCGFSKTLEIPKTFKSVTFSEQKDITELMQKQKRVLESLSLKNIIVMKKTVDKSDIVQDYGLRTIQEYNIGLTPEGKTIMLGETGDSYVLNLFDVNDINILKVTDEKVDTLKINYKLNTTTLYKIMKENCESRDDNYLIKSDTLTIWIVNNKKKWEVAK